MIVEKNNEGYYDLVNPGDKVLFDSTRISLDIELINGKGDFILTYQRYHFEPMIEYSQSSGHGEISGQAVVYDETMTDEITLPGGIEKNKKKLVDYYYLHTGRRWLSLEKK